VTVLTTGLSLSDLRDLLREGCGNLTVDQLDDPKTDRLLNLALWDLDANFDFREKDETWEHVFVAADMTGPIPVPQELEAFQSLAIMNTDGERFDVIREERDEYEANTSLEINARDTPTRYHRWGSNLYLRPWPSSEQVGWKIIASITSPLETLVGSIPRNWHRIIVHKAMEFYFAGHREWALAAAASNYVNAAIGYQVSVKSKELRDSRWAGVSVPDRWPTNGSVRMPGTNGFNEF
jgi:hypothetical protein